MNVLQRMQGDGVRPVADAELGDVDDEPGVLTDQADRCGGDACPLDEVRQGAHGTRADGSDWHHERHIDAVLHQIDQALVDQAWQQALQDAASRLADDIADEESELLEEDLLDLIAASQS